MLTLKVHPGSSLNEALESRSLSAAQFAEKIGVSDYTVKMFLDEKAAITEYMASPLGNFFGVSPQFWLNYQRNFDLAVAREAENGTAT